MPVTYPKVKLWFVDENGEAVFGEGLAMLLEAVEKYCSICAASERLGMSYRYALHRISLAEKRLGYDLIRRRRGGVAGGSSELTENGKEFRLVHGYASSAPLFRPWKRILQLPKP